MRVIVTRPRHSAQKTAHYLRQMGHEPVLMPLFEPVHHPHVIVEALQHSHGPIAVTSAEAMRALEGHTIAPHQNRPVFAIGEATAEEARRMGFRVVTGSRGSGIDLAHLIAAHTRESVLYLAGAPRSHAFESALRDKGVSVQVEECYQMMPISYQETSVEAALSPSPDAVLFYSSQTAKQFFALPPVRASSHLLDQSRFLCFSAAVAAFVPSRFHKSVTISPEPNEGRFLSLL